MEQEEMNEYLLERFQYLFYPNNRGHYLLFSLYYVCEGQLSSHNFVLVYYYIKYFVYLHWLILGLPIDMVIGLLCISYLLFHNESWNYNLIQTSNTSFRKQMKLDKVNSGTEQRIQEYINARILSDGRSLVDIHS